MSLKTFAQHPFFPCIVPCTCDLSKDVHNYKHMNYASYFLKGLSDSYHNIHTQILLLDPLPNICRAYSMISQQEVTSTSLFNTTPTVLYTNNSTNTGCGRGRTPNKGSMLYTHCNKTNHIVESCYFKHFFHLYIVQRIINLPQTLSHSTMQTRMA